MADETFAPIQKLSPDDMAVKPNLHMSETYEDFSWESMYGELDWLPGGGLNKAHEAIDRHANGKNRDKVAMIWEGKNGEREDYTFGDRSEEHTSELQSLVNLVCRLLLEKKKRRGGEG